MADLRYIHEGNEATRRDIAKAPVVATGTGLPEEDTVFGFRSNETFLEWAKQTDHADRVENAIETIKAAQKREDSDLERAQKVQRRRVERTREDLEDLAAETGLKLGSIELYMRAKEGDLLEGPVLGSYVLHENSNFSGRFLPVFTGIAMPDFGWFGFDNRASSVSISGLGLATDRTWYRGRAFWMFGFPFARFPFAPAGFNDMASAGYAI
jgi:hypothetical protein